ncbi:hypothetical protein [Nostoc sp.]
MHLSQIAIAYPSAAGIATKIAQALGFIRGLSALMVTFFADNVYW